MSSDVRSVPDLKTIFMLLLEQMEEQSVPAALLLYLSVRQSLPVTKIQTSSTTMMLMMPCCLCAQTMRETNCWQVFSVMTLWCTLMIIHRLKAVHVLGVVNFPEILC